MLKDVIVKFKCKYCKKELEITTHNLMKAEGNPFAVSVPEEGPVNLDIKLIRNR